VSKIFTFGTTTPLNFCIAGLDDIRAVAESWQHGILTIASNVATRHAICYPRMNPVLSRLDELPPDGVCRSIGGRRSISRRLFCCNCARSLILISQKLDDPIMSKRDVAAIRINIIIAPSSHGICSASSIEVR